MPNEHEVKTDLAIQKIQSDIEFVKKYLSELKVDNSDMFVEMRALIKINTDRIDLLEKQDIKLDAQLRSYRVAVPALTAIIGALGTFILTNYFS